MAAPTTDMEMRELELKTPLLSTENLESGSSSEGQAINKAENSTNNTIHRKQEVRKKRNKKEQKENMVLEKQKHRRRLLLFIKWTTLCFVACCALAGTVVSKITLASITGRMYSLTNVSSNATVGVLDQKTGSKLFIQLVSLMVFPEVVSFFRCLVWGVIGKTTDRFPWPSKTAIAWVRVCVCVLNISDLKLLWHSILNAAVYHFECQ